MSQDLVMPKLGLTMTEGVLAEWRVQPGQSFKVGDVLLVVETDKIASEVEADSDGVLIEATVPAGETVIVGTSIGRWSVDGVDIHSHVVPSEPPSSQPAATKPSAAAAGSSTVVSARNGERLRSTPLARRRANELGVDLARLIGTGPHGRIKVADVETAAQMPVVAEAEPTVLPMVSGAGTRTKPSTMQATMARRLTAAKRDVPHFYLAAEAEVSELLALRGRLNADIGPGEPKVSITHLVLAAVGRALVVMPEMDRVWDEGEIVTLGRGDIGMAVNAPRGLVVPVLQGAARLSLNQLAMAAITLTDRARDGRLREGDFQGGAVGVSSAGMHNVTYMSSIIAPGQSSILGVGSIRPVFRPDPSGAPVLKQEMGLVLSADHRLFDGVTALAFLNQIIAGLERPYRLLRSI